MAQKTEYQDLEVKGTVKANEFADGVLKNSGFEVVTALPTTGLFAGREVMYNGKKYVYSSGWKEEITADTMYEDKLLYNAGTIVPDGSIIDRLMQPSSMANVYAYTKPEAISVQYSQDAGVTWVDYELSDIDKRNLCTFRKEIYCGGPDVTSGNINYRLRVNLFPKLNNVYIFHKLFLGFIYGSSYNRWLTVRGLRKNQEDIDTNYVTIINKGYIYSNAGNIAVNLGNIDMLNYYDKVVLDIGYDGVGTDKGLSLISLSMYAICSNPTNYLARYGRMYFFDINKTSYFDGAVNSKELINFDVNNIEPTQTGNAVTKTSKWLWQYLVQGVNWLRAKINNSSMSLNGTNVNLGDTAILPWYVDYNDVNYPARLRDNCLQIYRNGVWGNLMYLSGQEAIHPTQVVQITSFDNLDWYNAQVSEYEVDDSTTISILNGTTLPAAVLLNSPAEQLTLNLYPISGGKYGKGSLDSLISDLQGKGFSVFVENDLDVILASGNNYLIRIKISKVPTPKAIIECYIGR